jgi:glycosyltransferase involved in cell wall biosynthesis
VPTRIPVAIALTSFDAGGTERQMVELIARLDPSRFARHVVCFRREGPWLGRVEATADSVTRFELNSFRSASTPKSMLRFAAWCRRHGIAVVQACDFYANVFALPAAAIARVPVRVGSRRDILLPVRSEGQHRLQRLAYRFAHHVVANSRAAGAQLMREGVPESRIAVVSNGIDLTRFQVRPSRGPRRVVTTVANLRAEKGHEVLLDAARLVLARHPDVEFRLAGDGPMRPLREQQARDLGIEPRVRFLGHAEDIPALLGASDIFVLPSRTEAFPNGLIEAMAAGLPCVASNVGGIPELVQHERNGLLVPPADPALLADAIMRLIEDEGRAAAYGAAGRATVESRYSFDRMVSAFESLYLDALGGSGLPIRAVCAR